MSSKISDVVSVDITRAYARVAQQGFGIPLLLAEHSRIADRVKAYSSLEEMRADNFRVGDKVYDAAVALMSQTPKVESFKVGRKAGNFKSVWKVSFSQRPFGGTFDLQMGTLTAAMVAYDATESAIEVAVNTSTNIAACSVTVTPTSGSAISSFVVKAITQSAEDTLTIDPALLEDFEGNPGNITATVVQEQLYSTADVSWSDAWSAIMSADEDWYGLITPDLHSASDRPAQLFLANMIETQERKIYACRSSDANLKIDYSATSPADIADDTKAAGYTKTFVTYTSHTDEYPDAAIVGVQFPKKPGSSTYMFKSPVTITAEVLSASDKNSLRSKSANYVEMMGANKMYAEGTTCEGEFIDITIGCDFVGARVGEMVFAKLIATEKITYDGAGFVLIEGLIRSALTNYGVANGIIDGSTIVIKMPDLNTIPVADKAARIVNNIEFTAKLLGAIHKVHITGKLYL